MKTKREFEFAIALWLVIAALSAACAPSPPGAGAPRARPTLPNLATTIEIPPFPYAQPLPPPNPSPIDELYFKIVQDDSTPTPCKRCAGYRIEGGVWMLYFDKGVYKIHHPATGFSAVGSFIVSGDRLSLFNDPYCEEDLQMTGTFAWALDANTLTLQVIDDPCSIGLRGKNLAISPWTRVVDARNPDPCQPPNIEAAITDHWPKPTGCK